jgi:hypothetical protein
LGLEVDGEEAEASVRAPPALAGIEFDGEEPEFVKASVLPALGTPPLSHSGLL